MKLASGVTDQYIYFVTVDASDLSTRVDTGLNFVVKRSRNGGAWATYVTPTINSTDTGGDGIWELLVDEDTTIDAGDFTQEMVIHIEDTGGRVAPVTRIIELFKPLGVDTGAANRLGTFGGRLSQSGHLDTGSLAGTQQGTIDANVTYVNETAVTGTGDTGTGDTWRPV